MFKPGWTPTAKNINALPDPVRSYIHDLETLCDPQYIMRESALVRDENESLRILIWKYHAAHRS